jgi:hypothetical protein
LKYKKTLYFDFGILDNTGILKFLLEFNGKQHYEFVKIIHKTLETFENGIIRDNMKSEYCKNKNIKLNIIRYDEDIDTKLNEIFNI